MKTTPNSETESLLVYVKRKLGEHKGAWREISERTRVPYFTMAKIHQDVTENPRVNTVQALADFFRDLDSKKSKMETVRPIDKLAA